MKPCLTSSRAKEAGSCSTRLLKADSKVPAWSMAVFLSIRVPRECLKRELLTGILQLELLITLFPVFDVERVRFPSIDLAAATRWLGQSRLAAANSGNRLRHKSTLKPAERKS
jgi:hypothetical protein